MKNKINLIIFLSLILLIISCLNKNQISDPGYVFKQNKKLGRGINLGNALEAPREGAWGVTLKEKYFKIIKDAGFDSVRIPIRWSAHADKKKSYKIDKNFFDRVDWAIDNAFKNKLNIVINIHHYEELMKDPKNHQKRFLFLWKQIAEHYKKYPDNLFFELLNEPCHQMDSATWNTLLIKALNIVRKSNPERTIIIGPVRWNKIDELDSLKLPDNDRNIIVTIHYYEPIIFTHQGSHWANNEKVRNAKDVKWTGSDNEKKDVTDKFIKAFNWAKKENRPLYLGEFGVLNTADMTSRALWNKFIKETAEKNNMSWAYWEFCSTFGAYNQHFQKWYDELLNALITK